MGLRRELLIAVGTLALLNLLLAFGAMGLFLRMSPAIGRILEENDFSIEATEDALAVLASTGGGEVPGEGRDRIRAALARARSNLTEPEEVDVLASMDRRLDAALEGDAEARADFVRGCESLLDINRSAMERVAREAQRLGRAGAWAAAFIGILASALCLLLARRLRIRVVAPVREIHEALKVHGEGEAFRRCLVLDAPTEIRRVAGAVNRLLDARMGEGGKRVPGDGAEAERAALLGLLDRHEGGAVFVDATGTLRAASAEVLERLAGPGGEGIRAGFTSLPREEGTADLPFEAIRVRNGYGWICFLNPPPTPA